MVDYQKLYEESINKVKDDIRSSIKKDVFIIQAINSISELDRSINNLCVRLSEWYGYYFPELERISNEGFIEIIINKKREDLMKELKISKTMGCDLDDSDLDKVISFAKQIQGLVDFREDLKKYLESLMKKIAPNVNAVAGTMIGAKLIEISGSLERMSKFPASTIQTLGAEKALFRHMRSGSSPPKYGVIYNHPLLTKASEKGKAARMIADKISIASKVDFFKGEFVGDKLYEEIENKLK